MQTQTTNLFKSTLVLLVVLALALTACGPSQSATTTASSASSSTSNTTTGRDSNAQTVTIAKINLNTASESDFLTIPNVGSRMVREFNEYRPYTSITQFRREIGKYVDAAQVAAYEQYLYVPVDINSADAETLMQLPGVDSTLAADLIAARPYASAADFLAKLNGKLSDAELTVAKSYLANS